VVYFQDLGGTFYALDEKTGAVLAQLFTGGSVSGPAVSRGEIFLGQGNILANGFTSPGGIVALGLSQPEQNAHFRTNLVSDIPGQAGITDPTLKNLWGVSFSSTGPFWVSAQGTNANTPYFSAGINQERDGLFGSIQAIPLRPRFPHGPGQDVRHGPQDDASTMPSSSGALTQWIDAFFQAFRAPGRLGYDLRMIRDCALTPEDLWAPKPEGKKPIQVRKG
jgi:hypothetical protein